MPAQCLVFARLINSLWNGPNPPNLQLQPALMVHNRNRLRPKLQRLLRQDLWASHPVRQLKVLSPRLLPSKICTQTVP